MSRFTVHHGDCLAIMPTLPEASVDSIVTDPPYGLSFMGKEWDHGVPGEAFWREALRVAKPGAFLLAFGGTRTFHRLTCAIEDAGWQIRDCIMWVYGSGFPKGKACLKPAWEPIIVARRPGPMAPLRIDDCRIGCDEITTIRNGSAGRGIYGGDLRVGRDTHAGRWPANLIHDGSEEVAGLMPHDAARFFKTCESDVSLPPENRYIDEDKTESPSCQDQSQTQSCAHTADARLSLQSVLVDTVQSGAAIWQSLAGIVSSDLMGHSTPVTESEFETICEVVTCAIAHIGSGCSQDSQQEKRTQTGSLVSVAATRKQTGTTTITASLLRSDGFVESAMCSITPTNLDLGALGSRFSYCAKASKRDRDEGCDDAPIRFKKGNGSHNGRVDIDPLSQRWQRQAKNHHPTVKPTDLMRYLCRLVTHPGGTVLDPFTGSGSTGKAAMLEGLNFIGCELSEEYVKIAEARISDACNRVRKSAATDLFGEKECK